MYDSAGNPITFHFAFLYALLTVRILFDVTVHFGSYLINYMRKVGRKIR